MITTREIRDLILSGANLNELDENFHTPLNLSCKHNNLNAVKLLVEAGANVNAEDGYGYTPLMISCLHDYNNISEYLLANGADINHQVQNKHFNSGKTLLMMASKTRYYDTVKFIIDHGADVNVNVNGWTALFDACIRDGCGRDYDNLRVVELLVYNDIDINMQTWNGWTALMRLCNSSSACPEIVQFLLDFGADKSLVNNEGKNALYYAKHPVYGVPSYEIIRILSAENQLENVEHIPMFIDENCPICLNTLGENSIKTMCGHYFHENCLLHWKKQANTCPSCRASNSFFGHKKSKKSKKSKKFKKSKKRSKKHIFKI